MKKVTFEKLSEAFAEQEKGNLFIKVHMGFTNASDAAVFSGATLYAVDEDENNIVNSVNHFKAKTINDNYDLIIKWNSEYNACIKELSEAAWMNEGEPMYYDMYKAAYSDAQIAADH